MNHSPDHERLLADVLAEAASAELREALLAVTLGQMRRRRHWRQARSGMVVLAALGVLVVLLWRMASPHPGVMPPAEASYTLIHTQPLPARSIVATEPFATSRLIASAPIMEMVRTATTHVAVRAINDDELLSLVGSRPAALVRLGPDTEELIFVNPEDWKGFPLN